MHFARSFRALPIVLALGCASVPPAPAPGTGTLYGDLTLRPRDGVTMPAANDPPYQARAMRDARIMDSSRPGFAVVYLASGARPGERVTATIRANDFETRLEPRWLALYQGGVVAVTNASKEPHTVSCPDL